MVGFFFLVLHNRENNLIIVKVVKIWPAAGIRAWKLNLLQSFSFSQYFWTYFVVTAQKREQYWHCHA